MLFSELPISFPWYDKLEKQNRFRENASKLESWGVISPSDALLPFQFWRVGTETPDSWHIVRLDNGGVYDLNADMLPLLRTVNREGKTYYYYAGEPLQTVPSTALYLSEGLYYSRINFSDGSFQYSEVFVIPQCRFLSTEPAPFLRLEWYNDTDIRPIFYNAKDGDGVPFFRNVAYLDSFITQSEPEIEQEGEPDGDDEDVPTFQKAIIKYRITEMMPDFLKKAVVLSQMHDHIFLTTKDGVRDGELFNIETNTTPEAGGGLSVVDIIFQEELLTKRGCGDNMNA